MTDGKQTNKAKNVTPLSPLRRVVAIALLMICASAVLMSFLFSSAEYSDVIISPLQLLGDADSGIRWMLTILWVAGIGCSAVFAIRVLRAKKPVSQRFAFATLAIVMTASFLTNWLVSKCIDICPDTPGLSCIIGVKCIDKSNEIIFCLVFVALLVVLAWPNIIKAFRTLRQKRKAYLRSINKRQR